MNIRDLMSGDREQAADVLRVLAGEVEEGCTVITNVVVNVDPLKGMRLGIELVGTGKHDDDLLPR